MTKVISKKLKKYHAHPEADLNTSSAVAAIEFLLGLPATVRPTHKKHFLRHAIWLFTTANGKNSNQGKINIRYVSEGVRNGGKHIRHEHVVPIKELIEELLENARSCKEILKDA